MILAMCAECSLDGLDQGLPFLPMPMSASGASGFRLPLIGLFPVYAKVGGLVSYGPNNFELFKQPGGIIGKILRGAKPAEFPIQRPVYMPFLINMHTAKLLQVVVPPSLLALADEVIE